MLLVALVAMAAIPVAQMITLRATFAGLEPPFRDRVEDRTAPVQSRDFRFVPAEALEPSPSLGEPFNGLDPLVTPGDEAERLFVLVGDLRAGLRQSAWIGAGVALLLGVVLALTLSRSVAKPIEAVSRAASDLAAGRLGTRVKLRGARRQPREARALATDFNVMAASLERFEGERRAMIADVAHELRTPLAALTMRLEAIADGLVTADPHEIQVLRDQTDLLTRLVEDLRTFSLADAGRLSLSLAPVDLAAAATSAADALRPAFEKHGVALVVERPEGLAMVHADHHRLQQVLGNLLENALRVSPPDSTVVISVEHGAEEASVSVRDSGPGIQDDELTTIFERFVQGRRRDMQGTQGSGLGLAIVRTLVELHGGTVAAANHDDGALVTVALPAANS